ncbi:hypothetical protein MFLAVUS_006830 [Mucor flavus]|uniref:Uncharacterized protein n=1 Tax=Mucor flavus TaxID=439312 RepID=A0ABP9Z2L5_9FUNG
MLTGFRGPPFRVVLPVKTLRTTLLPESCVFPQIRTRYEDSTSSAVNSITVFEESIIQEPYRNEISINEIDMNFIEETGYNDDDGDDNDDVSDKDSDPPDDDEISELNEVSFSGK